MLVNTEVIPLDTNINYQRLMHSSRLIPSWAFIRLRPYALSFSKLTLAGAIRRLLLMRTQGLVG